MTTYRYAVKVRLLPGDVAFWRCHQCGAVSPTMPSRRAFVAADVHTSLCEDLHRANWDAACPSCKAFGKIAKACPVCLGRGWCK